MTFGKKGVSELDRPIDEYRATRRETSERWRLSRGDIRLALGVAATVFTGVCFFAGDIVRAVTPAGSDVPQTRIFAYEPDTFDRSYGPNAPSDLLAGSMAMMVRMTMTPHGPDAIDRELYESCLTRINGNAAHYAARHGEVPLHPQTAARFLVCSMQVFKGRFCEAPYKARIVARLEDFVRSRRAGAEGQAGLASPDPAAMQIAVAKTARTPMQVVPPILAEQLRVLSEVSLISRVDFPNDVPEELKPYLAADAGPSPCA